MKLLAHMKRAASIVRHPANKGQLARTLLRAARFRLGVARNRPVELSVLGGNKLRCYPDSNTARSVAYYGPAPDVVTMSFMQLYLRPGDAFLDAGANIGLYTLIAAAFVGAEGRIDAVEPVPATLARLEENLRLNGVGIAHIHRFALGDEDGEARMTSSKDETNYLDDQGGVSVPLRRLDTLFPSQRFAFAKFDLEGAELAALRGAERLLRRGALPVFVFELNGASDRFGVDSREVLSWLEERGYFVGTFDPASRSVKRGVSPGLDPLAVHRAHVAEIQRRVPGFELAG